MYVHDAFTCYCEMKLYVRRCAVYTKLYNSFDMLSHSMYDSGIEVRGSGTFPSDVRYMAHLLVCSGISPMFSHASAQLVALCVDDVPAVEASAGLSTQWSCI